MTQKEVEEEIIEAGRRRGSELLGHVGVALWDTGDFSQNQIIEGIREVDVDSWWETWGGPMIDDLASMVPE